MLEGEAVGRGLLNMIRPDRAARFRRVAGEVQHSVAGYMLGNITTSIIAGIVVGITLYILGVPFALLLALWVGLVDLLPLVGGLLAAIPVVLVALFHSFSAFLITLIVFLVYQQIENHVLNPVIMSRTVRLNPLWVLLAVLVAAKLGGTIGGALGAFVGALIGIPLGGAIQVVVRELRQPEPLLAPSPSPEVGSDTEGPGTVS
jgi:predicted PurR-regulated permease PerM